MTDREIEAFVAKKLWPESGHQPDETALWWNGQDPFLGCGWFAPLSDANADYEVLERVRMTWDEWDLHRMGVALIQTWCNRNRKWYEESVCYEPGDYTRAAYAVLKEGRG